MTTFPNLNNIRPESASVTRKAKGRIRDKSGRGRIGFLGTSIPAGQGSNPASSGADVARRCYPTRLAEALSGYGVPSQWQSAFGNKSQANNLPTWDPRVSLGAGWSYDGSRQTFGGQILNSSGVGALGFGPTQNVDTYETYSFISTGNGTLTVTVGGAAPASGVSSINQNAAPAIGKAVSKSSVLGTGALALTPTSATITRIIGMLAYDSTAFGWDILNGAIPSSFVSEMSTPTSPNNPGIWTPSKMITAMSLDLVIVDALTNTRNFSATSLQQALADMLTTVTDIKAAGADVLIVLSPPSNPTTTVDLATQLAWAQAFLDFAIANNCMFDDWYSRHGTFAAWQSAGFFYDNIHPSNFGAGDYGDHLASVVMSI